VLRDALERSHYGRNNNWRAGAGSVAAATRRAKHFGLSEMERDVQPLSQKYLSFRKTEIMI
jgi:hypothetical protein